MNKLTSKNEWKKHWSKKNLVREIGRRNGFSDIFQNELKGENYKSFIEIGGYPGYFSIYFKKYWEYDVTLLDYISNNAQIGKLLRYNGLSLKEINVVSSDFLSFKTDYKYDVVFSFGFIEHFTNIEEILKKHWKLVKPGGKLIIIYPNFLGINGLLQVVFDPDNLIMHNLSSMVIKNIREKMLLAGIHKYKIFYDGGLMVWLENLKKKKFCLRIFIYLINFVGLPFRFLKINSRFISPYIVLLAQKD